MSQIEKSIAQFVGLGHTIDGIRPDVRVEVISAKVEDIQENGNSENVIFTVTGQKYKHNGYINANELVFNLLKEAKKLNRTVIVRLERKRKKGVDPKAKIMDLTKDMNTARDNAVKTTVGIYDENSKKWLLTNEAETDPKEDPTQVTSGIDSVNYDKGSFFEQKQPAKSFPHVNSNRELNNKADSLVTLYFFLLEHAKKINVKLTTTQLEQYSQVLLKACDYVQVKLFNLKSPVYSDYSYTRTRYLLFNYTDHWNDFTAEDLKDIDSIEKWSKGFIMTGGRIWSWAIKTSNKQ